MFDWNYNFTFKYQLQFTLTNLIRIAIIENTSYVFHNKRKYSSVDLFFPLRENH